MTKTSAPETYDLTNCDVCDVYNDQRQTDHMLTDSPSAAWMSTALKSPTLIPANPLPLLERCVSAQKIPQGLQAPTRKSKPQLPLLQQRWPVFGPESNRCLSYDSPTRR